MRYLYYKHSFFIAALMFSGCADTAIDSNSGDSRNGDPNAESLFVPSLEIQAHPYELVRSQLISIMGLSAASAAISTLDTQRVLFGALPAGGGAPRNLNLDVARRRSWMNIANDACSAANLSLIFPTDPFDTTYLWSKWTGRSLAQSQIDSFNQIVSELNAANPVVAQNLKQSALCLVVLADLRSQSDI